MAETTNTSGLASSLDPTKYPVYGTTTEQQQEYIKSNEELLKSLENRFAQPNWFKVAAGFAKPQLGGFTASLGSAAEALGENVEQQRAMAVPIAEMRAKLAQSKAVFGQNVDISQKVKEWREAHPGQMPPPTLLAHWEASSPESPAVKSLLGQQKSSLEQQGQALQILKGRYESGSITKAEFAEGLKQLQSGTAVAPQGAPMEKATAPAASTGDANHRLSQDLASVKREIASTKPNEPGAQGRLEILRQEEAKLESQLKSSPTFEELGASPASTLALTQEKLSEANKAYVPRVAGILQHDPETTSTANVRHNRLTDLLTTPGVQKGVGILYKDQGAMTALMNAVDSGIKGSISTPGGGAGINLSLPVQDTINKMNLSPAEQAQLREFQLLLSAEASQDLRQGVASVGGGHMNQAEFSSVMNRIMSGSDPYGTLKAHVAVRAIENQKAEKVYDLYGEWINSPGNANKPLSVFFHSPEYKKAIKEFEPKLAKAKRLAD